MITPVKHINPDNFETAYIRLRKWEKRIYADEEVAQLPVVTATHLYYKEWQLRKESSKKLFDYLKRRILPTNILEVGCGNGWLSAKLAGIKRSHVVGVDINNEELEQAKRVFSHISNLQFYYSNINEMENEMKFDVIVFAAAIQYFNSLKNIITNSLMHLNKDGEIHIIDSPFYTLSQLAAAKQRTLLYYQSAGFPEMANKYFHHNLDDLENYNCFIHYDPNSLFTKFLRNKNPFYWISIKP
ncbi:MAG TPA: methyltransferase domain-containing protein [Chitinophagaceae bacterium]|nr:methyltransferase domain-containing protein [Chitinophagaceae bacterium]